MKINNLSIIGILLLLTGCANFTKSEAELIETGVKSPTFCVKDSFASAATRLESYLKNCYKTNLVTINGIQHSPTFLISKAATSSENNYIIKMPQKKGYAYLFLITLEHRSGNCPANLTAIRSIKGIGNPFKPFEAIANDKAPSCPV